GDARLRCGFSRRIALGNALGEAECAIGSARSPHRIDMRVGTECLELLVEADPAAIVAPQVKRGIEAARHGDEIAIDLRLADHPPTARPIGRDPDAGDREPAEARLDTGNGRTR